MTASTQLSSLLRWLGRSAPFASAPDQARALRRQIMRATVDEIRRQGYATSDDVLYLRNVIDGQSPHGPSPRPPPRHATPYTQTPTLIQDA